MSREMIIYKRKNSYHLFGWDLVLATYSNLLLMRSISYLISLSPNIHYSSLFVFFYFILESLTLAGSIRLFRPVFLVFYYLPLSPFPQPLPPSPPPPSPPSSPIHPRPHPNPQTHHRFPSTHPSFLPSLPSYLPIFLKPSLFPHPLFPFFRFHFRFFSFFVVGFFELVWSASCV